MGVQVKPGSVMQVDEQPSPLVVLPSSHCSPGSMLPLPQLTSQARVVVVPVPERQAGSSVHVFEQPRLAASGKPVSRPSGPGQPEGTFFGSVPQSQPSFPSLMPLPQVACVHLLGVPVHVDPGSMRHFDEQPSPFVLLPSSHASLPSSLPLPHMTVSVHMPPVGGQV